MRIATFDEITLKIMGELTTQKKGEKEELGSLSY